MSRLTLTSGFVIAMVSCVAMAKSQNELPLARWIFCGNRGICLPSNGEGGIGSGDWSSLFSFTNYVASQ